jgi:hypothetical protein
MSIDSLYGRAGSDLLLIGPQDDAPDGLKAGKGDDTVYASRQDNEIISGWGADSVYAGRGDDVIGVHDDGKVDSLRCGRGKDKVLYIQNRRDREARRDRKDRLSSCETIEVARPKQR